GYRCLTSMVGHLLSQHKTTPKKEGLAFRCDCGCECYSTKHTKYGKQCEVTNFKLVRKTVVIASAIGKPAVAAVTAENTAAAPAAAPVDAATQQEQEH
ncbi:hypothetical protein PFISCL1PPCAC_12451, partial [Pristionchus fissidentatus]